MKITDWILTHLIVAILGVAAGITSLWYMNVPCTIPSLPPAQAALPAPEADRSYESDPIMAFAIAHGGCFAVETEILGTRVQVCHAMNDLVDIYLRDVRLPVEHVGDDHCMVIYQYSVIRHVFTQDFPDVKDCHEPPTDTMVTVTRKQIAKERGPLVVDAIEQWVNMARQKDLFSKRNTPKAPETKRQTVPNEKGVEL